MDQEKLHVAIISSPGMGHLIPVLLLGNRLATHHHLHATILAVTTQTSYVESQLLASLMDSRHINIIKIPLVDISNLLHPNDAVVTQLAVMMREARHGIRSAISAMTHRPDVLIADVFSSESLPIADEFHMRKYVYVPCSARFVSVTTYCHVLDEEIKGQYVDQREPLMIPGCDPVRCEDVPDPMLDRNNQQYKEYVRMGIDFATLSDGILMNTWTDLEPKSSDALKFNKILRSVVKVPVYNIGPLTREVEESSSKKSEVIEWLDRQPLESVLFVSFGSGGTPSADQITELAWGLELSQQRFLWVIRPPAGSSNDGAFFTAGTGTDGPPEYLPEGFLTRTQRVGLVLPLWAPQVEILNHRSVGGFLSHCGFNSVLESIKGGVPMIAWPLYAEQRLNASIVAEEQKVGVRPAVLPTKKVVGREEIEQMARRLMESEEGKRMREKVKALGESAKEALGIEGSSYNSMCEFIKCCEKKMTRP
ncbi:anthocyanidin 3-O-glucosyltransferase 5-like [Cynara cardunculus var. scolymus]|uniref:Glycosyltransferase n=1 Tax=Cynara cardunculus var. scolymus TaxID=59895 RepID=A0A103YGW5_CYNCS|nr:anthocyanidin 3-O-glucosyltransferase 5-like [Cynara cardunculus var. scolymus]KVI08876.1 UDP-glucuronosyl/UDP-glucosyltransferase [Cynara cardunculus var. scolymus]